MPKPFGLIELALQQLIEDRLEGAQGKVGGDLSYDASQDFYVWIGLVPGGGSSNEIEGEWTVDIAVFGTNYIETMRRALDLEAALVGPRHRTAEMRIDNCYVNTLPTERPWDDENVYRIEATYVFTARRA